LKKLAVKGSYTVEAALLFPCILIFIIGLLYLGFYMHDKVKLQSVLNNTMVKARALILNEADMNTGLMDYEEYKKRGIFYLLNNNMTSKEEEIKTYFEKEIENGLFISDIKSVHVTASQSKVSIKADAHMEFPLIDIQELFVTSGLMFRMEGTFEIHNPMEFIRIFDVFSNTASKAGTVDKVLKDLQIILNKVK
jgi:hypothetical protein